MENFEIFLYFTGMAIGFIKEILTVGLLGAGIYYLIKRGKW